VRRREFLYAVATSGLLSSFFPALAAPSERVIVSKIALLDGRAVMALTIHGTGPWFFMIDTGGHLSLIDDALAHSLQLEQTGTTLGTGVGGPAAMPLYSARDVVFGGGAIQPSVAFAGMKQGFRGDVRGALAAGMLTAVDSDLDFEKGEWRAYPDGRPDRTGFMRLGNAIVGGERANSGSPRLFGEATVNGRRLRFLLDTGAPGGASLTSHAARALGLWNDARPWAPQQTRGIGGVGDIGRIVRADSLAFGGRTFARPLVLLRGRKDEGASGVDGILGLDVLRQFILSTEPRTSSLWVKAFDAPPQRERYGFSGLWIDPAGDGARVAAVGTASPAAVAGLAVGDKIVGESFADLVRKITGPENTPVTLMVVRGGAPRQVNFTLARFL
jgi:hypothetical protein